MNGPVTEARKQKDRANREESERNRLEKVILDARQFILSGRPVEAVRRLDEGVRM